MLNFRFREPRLIRPSFPSLSSPVEPRGPRGPFFRHPLHSHSPLPSGTVGKEKREENPLMKSALALASRASTFSLPLQGFCRIPSFLHAPKQNHDKKEIFFLLSFCSRLSSSSSCIRGFSGGNLHSRSILRTYSQSSFPIRFPRSCIFHCGGQRAPIPNPLSVPRQFCDVVESQNIGGKLHQMGFTVQKCRSFEHSVMNGKYYSVLGSIRVQAPPMPMSSPHRSSSGPSDRRFRPPLVTACQAHPSVLPRAFDREAPRVGKSSQFMLPSTLRLQSTTYTVG